MTEYQVVFAIDRPADLINLVNSLLKDGWKPLGSISIATTTFKKDHTPDSQEGIRTTYAQAMIKES